MVCQNAEKLDCVCAGMCDGYIRVLSVQVRIRLGDSDSQSLSGSSGKTPDSFHTDEGQASEI